MAAFIILLVSIALGVLISRFYAKKGIGKGLRRTAGIASGCAVFIILLVVVLIPSGDTSKPTTKSPVSAEVATAASASNATSTLSGREKAETAEEAKDSPVYTDLTPEARAAAKHYIATLDAAIAASIKQLPDIDLRTSSMVSKHFNKLQARGKRLFGDNMLSDGKLWRCGAAGTFAGVLWRSHILWSGSPQKAMQNVKENKETYDTWRQYCLNTATGKS